MPWYLVDMEITFLGKEHKIVQADNKSSATIIAKKIVSKEFSCSENEIYIITCKEKKVR